MKGKVSRPLLLGTAIDHSSLDTVEQNRTSNQIKLSFRFQVLETIVISQIKPWFSYDLPKHQGFMWKNYWSHLISSFLCDLIFNTIRCSKSAICKFVVRKKNCEAVKTKNDLTSFCFQHGKHIAFIISRLYIGTTVLLLSLMCFVYQPVPTHCVCLHGCPRQSVAAWETSDEFMCHCGISCISSIWTVDGASVLIVTWYSLQALHLMGHM